jgi:hypothetical protein
MNLRVVFPYLVLVLVATTGCFLVPGQAAPGSRESPHAVFNTLVTALEKEDFQTAVACLDPDSVAKTAARGAWRGLDERDDVGAQWRKPVPDDGWGHRRGRDVPLSAQEEQARRKRQEKARRRFEVLDRHGLTKETSAALQRLPSEDAARTALAGRLDDPARFLAEFLQACETERPDWLREDWPRPRLEEVAFDGDTATGKVVFRAITKDDRPVRELRWDISFVRLSKEDWRVVGISMLSFVGVPWHWGALRGHREAGPAALTQ